MRTGSLALLLLLPALPSVLAARPPDVLLVTVDTLRPDALGWVAGANATPNVDRLAAEGFRFPAAVSPVPLTLPAHTSLMSGLTPRRHGVRDNGQVLSPAPALLAEAFRERGWATAAFVSGYPLHGLFGLSRGFDRYDDATTAGSGAWLERPAPETTAAALAWAAEAPRPFFLWVHYYDPHYPYTPPPALRRPGVRGGYDGEVAVVDAALGDLLSGLPAGPRLTLFAGDHGESLGEHGEATHGFFVYESTVAVPLIVHFPGRIAPGQSDAAARLVDVAPTIRELVGLAPADGVDGVSLVPLLAGEAQELPPAYVETYQPWTSYGWAPLKAVRDGGFKLIAAPRPELYDLVHDPGETVNLIATDRGRAHELAQRMKELEARPAAAAAAAVADPATLSALRALGYVGTGAVSAEPGPGLADPKDKIALREILTEAEERTTAGDLRGALASYDEVLAVEPDNRFAVSRSGEVLLRSGATEAGILRLRRAAQLDPNRPEVRALLAEALTRTGRLPEAVEQWMELVRLQPGRAEAWSNLGATLGRSGRAADAVAAFAKAAALAPGDGDRLVRLAFAEFSAHRLAEAADHLRRAAALQDESFQHFGALGLVLVQLGEKAQARGPLAQSRPTEGEFAEARFELAVIEAEAGELEAARRALAEALRANPDLSARAASDPRLRRLSP